MTDRFISSVTLETRGAHQHVTVFIRGRNVGTLVCGLGEGAPLAALIECANFMNLDKSGLDQGDPTGHERFEWTALASNWLDVEEITGPTGFVGRIVLRLLHALEVAESKVKILDAIDIPGALRTLQQQAIDRRPPDEWLIKDFNVLYRVARDLLIESGGCNKTATARARNAVASQLERLAPAYTLTETVRDRARQTGKIEPAPPDALESYERTKRAGEGD